MLRPIAGLRLPELDPGDAGGALEQGLQGDLHPGADRAAQVLAVRRDHVERDRRAEVDDDAGAAEKVDAAIALTSRSAPTSCGLSSWIGMPVFTPGPTMHSARR